MAWGPDMDYVNNFCHRCGAGYGCHHETWCPTFNPSLENTEEEVKAPEREGGSHYFSGRKFETWDVIHDWDLDYFLGNAVKYISRAGRKDQESFEKDIRKAIHYLNKRLELK